MGEKIENTYIKKGQEKRKLALDVRGKKVISSDCLVLLYAAS